MSTEGTPSAPEEPKNSSLREQLDFSKESGLDSDYANAYAPLLGMVNALDKSPEIFTLLAKKPAEFAAVLRNPIPKYEEYMAARHVRYQAGEQTAEIIRSHARGGYLLAVTYLVSRCNKLRENLLKVFDRGLAAVKENEAEVARDISKLKKNLETLDTLVIKGVVYDGQSEREEEKETNE